MSRSQLCENWSDEDFQAEGIALGGKALGMFKDLRDPCGCTNQ